MENAEVFDLGAELSCEDPDDPCKLLVTSDGKVLVQSFNEGGCNSTMIDVAELLAAIRRRPAIARLVGLSDVEERARADRDRERADRLCSELTGVEAELDRVRERLEFRERGFNEQMETIARLEKDLLVSEAEVRLLKEKIP